MNRLVVVLLVAAAFIAGALVGATALAPPSTEAPPRDEVVALNARVTELTRMFTQQAHR